MTVQYHAYTYKESSTVEPLNNGHIGGLLSSVERLSLSRRLLTPTPLNYEGAKLHLRGVVCMKLSQRSHYFGPHGRCLHRI